MDIVDISAIIIDDDSEAINLLEMFLRQFPEIRVISTSTNSETGLSLINKKLPDLIFLDIDMPDMTGLQVAESVKTKNLHSEIVFTTAYQHYAYNALTIEPLEFLNKPFCPEDIEHVIKKYTAKVEKKKQEQKIDKFIQSQSSSPKITIPTLHGVLILDINDIVYVKANKRTTYIYLQDGTVETATKSLNNFIHLLNSKLIFQIHRRTYVNLNYLQRIDKKKSVCIIRVNNIFHEETISQNCILKFESLNIYPNF